jgi:hypothetical protein
MSKKVVGIIIVLAAASLVGGGLIFMHYHKASSSTPTIISQKKNAPLQTPAQAKANNQPSQNVPISPTVTLTDLSVSQSNGSVHATAAVADNNDTTASCVFTFENPNDKPVVRQVGVSDSGKTCDSGNIPEQEFTFLGQWKLTLNYYVNGTQAKATTTITIK